jgi:hypothetical protein
VNNAIGLELGGLGYVIYWNTMTLQDAIDFAVGMIKVTITVQHFTAGIQTNLGAAATVGEPIDVAVVRPGGTVEWVQAEDAPRLAVPVVEVVKRAILEP